MCIYRCLNLITISELDKNRGAEAVQHSLNSEELAGQRSALIGRTIALIMIVPLTTMLTPWPGPLLTYLLLLVFAVLGWGAWWVAKSPWGKTWHQYAFVSADFMLLTFTLIYPNPLVPFDYPPQFALRLGTFVYFFILLAGLAFFYQPRLVLWGGISAVVSWSIGVMWLLSFPDTLSSQSEQFGVASKLDALLQPTYIDLGIRVQEVLVLLIVAGLLTLVVKRSRTVAQRQARLARERENLGRYFPEQTAQLLAARSDPFSEPTEHNAAVLFADLVAFTHWSEQHSAKDTINLLREVHSVLSQIVFRNQGTLDKFIGDGLMATFGTPEPSSHDASNALNAMSEMVEEFESLKSRGILPLDSTIKLAVGVHYGPVIMGNIGSKERLEFAVLGDTVNIASRLENATRNLSCRGVVSDNLLSAAAAENSPGLSHILEKLEQREAIGLRGVTDKVVVHTM